jgi:hypothetical protein
MARLLYIEGLIFSETINRNVCYLYINIINANEASLFKLTPWRKRAYHSCLPDQTFR